MDKMILKTLIFLTLSWWFSFSSAEAQSIFNFGNKPNQTPAAIGGGNAVMSPDDFKNAVTSSGQENMNDLAQQAKQLLKPTPLGKMNQANGGKPVPPAPGGEPGTEAPGTPNQPSTTSAISPTTPTAPANPAAIPQTTNPQQSDQYTGFNFGNTNNPGTGAPAKNSTSNSGGLNIKY